MFKDTEGYETQYCESCLELQKKLEVKEQECKEYKKKFSRFFNIDNQECWDIAFLNDEKAKYKQALDEIEKSVSKHCISTDDYNKIRNNKWVYAFSKGYATARWELINPILKIINKVKEMEK